jgi:hypothetical protein
MFSVHTEKRRPRGTDRRQRLISTPFTPFRSDSSPDADLQGLFVVRHRRKSAGVTGDSNCIPHGMRLSFGWSFRIIFGIINIPETFFSTSQRIGQQFCFLLQIFFLWRRDPTRVMASSFTRFSRSHTTTHHSR